MTEPRIPDDDEDVGMPAALVGAIVLALIVGIVLVSVILLCRMILPPI